MKTHTIRCAGATVGMILAMGLAHADNLVHVTDGAPLHSGQPKVCWNDGSAAPGASSACPSAVVSPAAKPVVASLPVFNPPPAQPTLTQPQMVHLSDAQTFAFNSARLTAKGRDRVDSIGRKMQLVENVRVQVTGYTDSFGAARYNQRLSERRAQVVRKELIASGLPADAVSAQGRGATHFVVDPATCHGSLHARIACQAANRRVDIEGVGPDRP